MVQNERRTNTVNDPYIIAKPVLGMWNLIGDAAGDLLARDRAELGPLFPNSVQVGAQSAPKCNVLFLYCALDASARISGHPTSMRDVIKAAGAHIAVLAADIPGALLSNREFGQSLSARSDWPANIVITLNRNGEHFGRFFRELFSQMQAGVTMPMAWVELAPQGPHQRSDIPGTICLMEAGHIAFGPRKA
jgi:hypothetical protein